MVFGPLQPEFYFFAVLAVVAFFVSFYIPGSFFTSFLKLKSKIIQVLISNVAGVLLWGAQGYIFGYFHVRWLTYVYLAVFALLFLWKRKEHRKNFALLKKEVARCNKKALAFILFGAVFQSLVMIGSGVMYKGGVEFYGTNAVDGVMHLSYIASIHRQMPPYEPGEFPIHIENYHYWSDLVMADLYRVWQLPISHIFFQYMPFYVSLLTSIAAYIIVRMWKGSRTVGMWSLFLLFFGGDATYLFMLVLHHIFGFYSSAIDNGATQFLNMPFCFAKMIFLTSLIPFYLWTRTKEKKWGLLFIFLAAPMVGFKIYFGLFAIVGFVSVVCCQNLMLLFEKNKKNVWQRICYVWEKQWFIAFLLVLFAAIASAIYLPPNKASGGLYYSPLEWPKLFMGPDNLNWRLWWLRKQLYEAHHAYIQSAIVDLIGIFVCLVSIYGTRLLGVFPRRDVLKKLGWEHVVFFIPTLILFNILGLYTLQVSGLFNVFNFMAVSAAVFSLFAAFILADWQKSKKKWKHVALILFVVFTVPRVLHDSSDFVLKIVQNHYDLLVTPDDMTAMKYIDDHTPITAIIQTHPNNRPEYDATVTSFFSNRNTFFTGFRMLETHNQPTVERRKILDQLFKSPDSGTFRKQLEKYGIDYVYLHKDQDEKLSFVINPKDFDVFYESATVIILKRK